VNRAEVLSTFLRKTIYERSPGVARQLLLDLPLLALRSAWDRYIIAPIQGLLEFDDSIERFRSIISDLFVGYETRGGRADFTFYPSHLRNPILEAGSELRLLSLEYDGTRRVVEPYSLVYKTRRDGHREEYFYVYDRTGGSSGPGIKTFFNQKIRDLKVLDERFAPRYPVDFGKAGEFANRSYFTKPFGSSRSGVRLGRFSILRRGWRYTIECSYCSRKFKRMRRSTTLKSHKDGYGNNCPGRRGMIVDQQLV